LFPPVKQTGPSIFVCSGYCRSIAGLPGSVLDIIEGTFGLKDSIAIMSKKQIFTLEYPVRCSPSILYEFLSTPAGLQEWFADKVDERDNVFSFSWNGTTDRAEVMESESEKYIRFHWTHAPKEEYFEFRIEKSEVTNQTILIIKDFAGKGEVKDQSQLWSYQVKDLFHRLGN
jgi:uncharacterized protein YndB with AHSA1/START domain